MSSQPDCGVSGLVVVDLVGVVVVVVAVVVVCGSDVVEIVEVVG